MNSDLELGPRDVKVVRDNQTSGGAHLCICFIKVSQVMIKISLGQRTDKQTHRTDTICTPHFQCGGIITRARA